MQKDETWDIVVVGGGAAGLTAAVTAASPDCRVLLLEKCAAIGGTTAMSVGSITGAGSRLQSRAGIRDSTADFLDDLQTSLANFGFTDGDSLELKKVLAKEVGTAIDWISDMGCPLAGPFVEAGIHRVPRMHNVIPNSRNFVAVLRKEAIKRGVAIRTGSRVSELITSAGMVTGVKVTSSTGTSAIGVKRAVILATGDYSSSREIKAKYLSEKFADVDGNNPNATGDGHLMAMNIGAGVRNMNVPCGTYLRFVSPAKPLWIEMLPSFPSLARIMGVVARHAPKSFFAFIAKRFITAHTAPSPGIFQKGAILINREGKRFTDELNDVELPVVTAQQPGKAAYVFLDANLVRTFSSHPNYVSTAPGIAYAYFGDYQAQRKDLVHSAQTVAELAGKISVNPTALTETINRYNDFAAKGKDGDFGRKSLGPGFHEGPFYVLGPLNGTFSLTEGGLTVDLKCRVLNREGSIIPKLYAVGSVGGGMILLPSHGTHIAWALVSGRIAGKAAREET